MAHAKGFYMRSPQYWRRHYPPCKDRILLGDALHPRLIERLAKRANLPVSAIEKTKMCPHWDIGARKRVHDVPAWKLAYCWYVLMSNKCPHQAKLDDFIPQCDKRKAL